MGFEFRVNQALGEAKIADLENTVIKGVARPADQPNSGVSVYSENASRAIKKKKWIRQQAGKMEATC